ncbi:hypothetical protein LJC48_06660 [Desulfovibrio sp. OttesenSCG-928-C06]|nr:hypothetical protein [Desulfovibrio sp. OttesenSCG-928-C06]
MLFITIDLLGLTGLIDWRLAGQMPGKDLAAQQRGIANNQPIIDSAWLCRFIPIFSLSQQLAANLGEYIPRINKNSLLVEAVLYF